MTRPRPRILVAGSINIDMIARTERCPDAGETLAGRELHIAPGGKGANQAVAATRLGAQPSLPDREQVEAFLAGSP